MLAELVKPIDLAKYNGKITVLNPATGNHRTFQVRTCKYGSLKGKRVVELLMGSDNQADYIGFGFVSDEGLVTVWKKKQETDFFKFADILSRPAHYVEKFALEYKMAVRCRKCNRELTDPVSIDMGIGPTCRGE